MSKYFPLPDVYKMTGGSIYGNNVYDQIYMAIRTILKDLGYPDTRRKYGLARTYYENDLLAWDISYDKSGGRIMHVVLPSEHSVHTAALLVKMGTHTIEETWDEYKDLWYEDLEKQLSHIEKGVGP